MVSVKTSLAVVLLAGEVALPSDVEVLVLGNVVFSDFFVCAVGRGLELVDAQLLFSPSVKGYYLVIALGSTGDHDFLPVGACPSLGPSLTSLCHLWRAGDVREVVWARDVAADRRLIVEGPFNDTAKMWFKDARACAVYEYTNTIFKVTGLLPGPGGGSAKLHWRLGQRWQVVDSAVGRHPAEFGCTEIKNKGLMTLLMSESYQEDIARGGVVAFGPEIPAPRSHQTAHDR